MYVKSNEIARKMVSKGRDIQAVALFNSAHKLIAYATPPGMHDIEHFRTKAKKRIVIMLFMLLFIFLVHSKSPLLCGLALLYVGGNTFFGWDKYHAYCQSTFAFNIGVTFITYSLSLYYAFYFSTTDLAIKSMIVSQYIHPAPLIFILLFTSVLVGYVLSKKYIGYIDTLSPTELQTLTLESIVKNNDIEKYVLTAGGDCNRLIIKNKTSSTSQSKNKTFYVQSAKNMGKLKK